MTDLIRRITFEKAKNLKTLPNFSSGDTVGVYVRVKEGEKERVQLFRGVVLKVQGSGIGRSFTVRKVSAGVGVERTFPVASPAIDRIEIISHGKIRRSRLFFLRGLKGRSARLESETYSGETATGETANEAAAPAEGVTEAKAAKTPKAKAAKDAKAK